MPLRYHTTTTTGTVTTANHDHCTVSAVAFPAGLGGLQQEMTEQQLMMQLYAQQHQQRVLENQRDYHLACSVTTCSTTAFNPLFGAGIATPQVQVPWIHHLDTTALEELERLITTPVRERLTADSTRRLEERRLEQQRAYEAHVREQQRQRREHDQRQREADAKAMKLLRTQLTKAQRVQMDNTGYFTVATPPFGNPRQSRTVKVRTNGSISGNIMVGNERYCVYPMADGMPMADAVLGQKLMLEADPEALFNMAVPRPRWCGGRGGLMPGDVIEPPGLMDFGRRLLRR